MSMGNGTDQGVELGKCCSCERPDGVRNVVLLEMLSPTPGRGWHCAECGLPPNGAVAVVCDDCFRVRRPLRWVCTGYPGTDGRTSWAELQQVPFHHDPERHGGVGHHHGEIGNAPRVLLLADAYFAALDQVTNQFNANAGAEPITTEEISAALGAVLSRVANAMPPENRAEWVALWVKTIREAAGIHLH
jgi:hypothetical protein